MNNILTASLFLLVFLMTYISMDDSTTIDNWKKLMIKEDIQWRSVMAVNNLEYIKTTFYNPVLPTVLMVYPDGKFEKIDVRNKQDRNKLYQTTKIQSNQAVPE